MKLYYSPGFCSLASHIVAREVGIALDLVLVSMPAHTLPDGSDFHLINPHGYVPVLELDTGIRLTEGPVILQYLADLQPQAGLIPPAGTLPRYQLQSWLGFLNSELHKTMVPLFDPSTPAAVSASIRAKISTRFGWLAQQLTGQPWLMGAHYSVADAYLFVVLGWLGLVGIDIQTWPALATYAQRVRARPAVQDALRAEGLPV